MSQIDIALERLVSAIDDAREALEALPSTLNSIVETHKDLKDIDAAIQSLEQHLMDMGLYDISLDVGRPFYNHTITVTPLDSTGAINASVTPLVSPSTHAHISWSTTNP